MGRVLGIDYGDVRIGVAVSDPAGIIATPLTTLRADRALGEIRALCTQWQVERIVVGLPLNMNGTEGPQAARVRAFIGDLQRALPDLPVETWDERLSSKAGERVLLEAGASRARRREVLDKLSAQIVLQSYLDNRNRA